MENAAYAREVAELFASSRRSISPAQLDAAARSASGSFTGVSAFARARSASTGASAAAAPQTLVRIHSAERKEDRMHGLGFPEETQHAYGRSQERLCRKHRLKSNPHHQSLQQMLLEVHLHLVSRMCVFI